MLEQRSSDWFALRCGKVTASRMSDLMARTKTGWGASRANYMAQLVVERLTGNPTEGFTSSAMQWGCDNEADALSAYQEYALCLVEPLAFAVHPTIADAGASPDGLVGEDGLVEAKCPETKTHIDTLLSGTVPEKYVLQMQWQMACLPGRTWCDFISFDPRLPEEMRLFVQRVKRDDEKIAELEREVRAFLGEVDAKVTALRDRYLMKEAA